MNPADQAAVAAQGGEPRRIEMGSIATHDPSAFSESCVSLCRGGARLSAMLTIPTPAGADVIALLLRDHEGRARLLRMQVAAGGEYPALTAHLPQAQAFERELFEDHGIHPVGHPWLKPLRRHAELEGTVREDRTVPSPGSGAAWPGPSPRALRHPFLVVEGSDVHEVAVGPVHAGIIEPGHFRFECHGEEVLHLEIQLGYQHRGVEGLMTRSSEARRLVVAESVAGDSVIGHALAHCQVVETLAGAEPPMRAQVLRGIALELERVANHVGDLGALCGDIGYLPGASYFGRLRGEFLNALMEISGNRFGRGLLVPGGVRFDIPEDVRRDLLARLETVERDFHRTAELVFGTQSVLARFEGTGVLTEMAAEQLGLVGPAARASGCDRDVRRDHPSGVYRFAYIPPAVAADGDVLARALVRRLEVERSLTFVREQLGALPEGPLRVPLGAPAGDCLAYSVVEGWRGECAHLAVTDAAGSVAGYRIVDASLHNWFGLALAMRGGQISDFPLCNKSFNLSYAGHDL
ncbi:MAG: NADH-quinone oxidoreductase subunit C [Candidatus Eisenbacteria bacterium]|nr:NADH-quinone oxidoreductase subunit C [Candidatus Eisenbacteria bacterium]